MDGGWGFSNRTCALGGLNLVIRLVVINPSCLPRAVPGRTLSALGPTELPPAQRLLCGQGGRSGSSGDLPRLDVVLAVDSGSHERISRRLVRVIDHASMRQKGS